MAETPIRVGPTWYPTVDIDADDRIYVTLSTVYDVGTSLYYQVLDGTLDTNGLPASLDDLIHTPEEVIVTDSATVRYPLVLADGRGGQHVFFEAGNYGRFEDKSVYYTRRNAITPLCYGDGSSGPCRCGNEVAPGIRQGCINSTGGGGVLTAGGTNSVLADDLVLQAAQCRAGEFGMFLQGGSLINSPFKDGLLCMGHPTQRLGFIQLDAAGAGDSSSYSIVSKGGVAPGDTRYYQFWFRDGYGASVCGFDSNLTSGLKVVWQ